MSRKLPDNLLAEFSRFVETNMGLSFPKEKWADLERGIRSAAAESGFGDAEACVRRLMSSRLSRMQVETLASHLTVGETYFFRDRKCLDILKDSIIPGLVRLRSGKEQHIRIWSAGCATGEEAYTAAMLLDMVVPALKKWNITILATDINPCFLQRAKEGIYSEWSFRETPAWVRETYFRKTANGLAVRRDIRDMVTFFYHNMIEDPFPSFLNNTNAMDIIFCRNVLMYFSPDKSRDVIRHFHRSLADNGWLIVSAVETSISLFSEFQAVNYPGVVLYRKSGTTGDVSMISCPARRLPDIPDLPLPLPRHPEARNRTKVKQPPAPAPVSPVHSPAESSPDDYDKAMQLYSLGRYAEAVETLNPSHIQPGSVIGKGRLDAKTMSLLARLYANQGRLSEARLWCELAVAAEKTDKEFHYLLATILQESGQSGEAIDSLKRTLYLDQDFVPAHFMLANLYRRLGKLKESQKHFEISLSLLRTLRDEDVLPGSEGMTTGRMIEIIQTTVETGSRR